MAQENSAWGGELTCSQQAPQRRLWCVRVARLPVVVRPFLQKRPGGLHDLFFSQTALCFSLTPDHTRLLRLTK